MLCRAIASAVTLAALLVLSAPAARAAVPLDKLTTADLRAQLNVAFTGERSKGAIAKVMADTNVPFTATPEGVDFSYVGGAPNLTWRYSAPRPLTIPEQDAVAGALRKVLVESLLQVGAPDGKPLLTREDAQALVKVLRVRREEANTSPTITTVANTSAVVGKATTVEVTVGDKETPAGKLVVTARTSMPNVLPVASIQIGGAGATRTLTMTPTLASAIPVEVTLRVTDEKGLYAETQFLLTVKSAKDGGDKPQRVYAAPARVAVVLYILPQPYCVPWRWCLTPCAQGYAWVVPAPAVPVAPLAAPRTSLNWGYLPAAPQYAQLPPEAPPTASAPAAELAPVAAAVPERVVPRAELLKGKDEQDWVALYDAGFRHYRAGRYAQAIECCAAAAELKDEPCAWYYLSLSLRALGDAGGAKAAARYAAALELTSPSDPALVLAALKDVQGPARAELGKWQAGVRDARTASAVLGTRPKLGAPEPPAPTLAGR